jgi:hypothetical protein
LIKATIAAAYFAKITLPAGHDCGNKNFLADPGGDTGNHKAGYFMPQSQRRFANARDTIVKIAKILAAYATACDFYKNFSRL